MCLLLELLYTTFCLTDHLLSFFQNFIDGRIPADYINACHENAHLGDASAKYLFISTECNFTTVTISKALSELDNCIYMINGMHNNNDVIDEYIHINPKN